MKEFLKEILPDVRTTDDVREVMRVLGALEERHYKLFINSEKKSSDSMPFGSLSKRIAELIPEGAADENKFFSHAKETLKRLPVLVMEVAFEPDEAAIRKISNWTRDNINPHLILEIERERSLGGGARLYFGGRFFEDNLEQMVNRAVRRGL